MKRVLAFTLTVLMLLSTLTCITFAATISVIVNPTVFVGGDFYNVVWVTNEAGMGYVDYTYNGTAYRVYDQRNGIVRTDDTIHTVKIPKEHLDGAGKYTAYSTLVSARSGYKATLGNTVSVTRSFNGYKGQSEINAWVVTDPHALNPKHIKNATSKLPSQNPNLLFMLGDLITFTTYKQVSSNNSSDTMWSNSLCYIFRLADALTSGTIPVVYARGNHETRAAYSTYLAEYIGGDTGELYFDFTYGPISSILLDYGEDKVDTHHEYTGFAHFEEYHNKQSAWLTALDGYPEADTATYKLAISHGDTIKNHFGHDWITPLTQYGSDLLISGHTHCSTLYVPENYTLLAKTIDSNYYTLVNGATASPDSVTQFQIGGHSHVTNFPHLICGCHHTESNGSALFTATQLTFKNGKIITHSSTDVQSLTTSFTIKAGLNEEKIVEGPGPERTPAAYEKPDYYAANDDNYVSILKVPNDATFSLITKPVVFDTGDNYTIVWASKVGEAASGQVRVHIDGTVYKFADTKSGYSNIVSNTMQNKGSVYSTFDSTKNIHSAVVPKKILEQGKYECVSQHLMYVGYTTSLELGYEVSTGLLDFDGYDKGEDVEMLVVSNWDRLNNMPAKLRTAAKTADVIVMNGDVAERMQTETDYINFIYDLGSLTNGKKPVYFVRGSSEMNGAFAPYVSKTYKTDTDEYYAKVTFGPVSSIILDTAVQYADSFAGYNNLIQGGTLRAKQAKWLAEQSYGDSEYNLVFSNSPELFNYLGTDYNKQLNAMGADLAVFSGETSSSFTAAGARAQNYATATNGAYNGDGTIATKLTFKDGVITVTAINESAGTIIKNTVNTADNAVAAYADVAEAAWYSDAVTYAATQSLMVGTSATTFSPEDKVTRGQAAVVLAALANADTTVGGETPFTDVAENAYYANAVAWCYENKVTFGTSETTFSPEADLTREQLCALIANMYPEKYSSVTECAFADFDTVADYAKTAVASLADAGVIVGMGNNKFMPKYTITRAQLAQILYAAGM